MDENNVGYYGLMVSTWELFRGDTSSWDDRFFYREIIQKYGEPVLDIGCSTGRLLLDYMEQDIDIDGVDLSAEMLALCRINAQARGLSPTLYQQPMQALEVPRRYRTIIVSSSSFQLLTNPAKAQQALRHFYEHLVPGGALVMSLMLVRDEDDPLDIDWFMDKEIERPEDGGTIRRWFHLWFDITDQLAHAETRYEVMIDGQITESEVHRQSPELRWYTQDQAYMLLKEAGFVNIQTYSGFTLQPASAEDRVFCITAERPESTCSHATT